MSKKYAKEKPKSKGVMSRILIIGSVVTLALGITGAVVMANTGNGQTVADSNVVSEASIKDAMTNTGNQILTAWSQDKIKAGDKVENLYKVAPDAFVVPEGIKMGIVYKESSPGTFALCGWGAKDGNGSAKTTAIAYKSPNGSFAPMGIDCGPAGANATDLTLKAGGLIKVDRPKDLKFPDAVSSPVDNAPVSVPAPAVQAPAPAPAKPATPMDWTGFIVGALVLGGLGVLIFMIAMVYKLSRRFKADAQKSKLNTDRWKELVERCDTIMKEWAAYELDPVKILDFPLLSDMRENTTIQFHNALRKAKHLRPSDVRKMSEIDAISSPFAKAVEDLENAFHTAETEAKRIRWNNFTADERKRLQTAKHLLNLAMDGGATDSERQSAYKRMQKELDGLIVVPKATILALEKKVNLMITDGRDSEDDLSVDQFINKDTNPEKVSVRK